MTRLLGDEMILTIIIISSHVGSFYSLLLSSKCRVRSRKIINMHNGRVSVELGRGKSLIFKLSR